MSTRWSTRATCRSERLVGEQAIDAVPGEGGDAAPQDRERDLSPARQLFPHLYERAERHAQLHFQPIERSRPVPRRRGHRRDAEEDDRVARDHRDRIGDDADADGGETEEEVERLLETGMRRALAALVELLEALAGRALLELAPLGAQPTHGLHSVY